MTLRRRLMLMSALAVGATVALASLVCYVAMRGELRAQVDHRLRTQGELVQRIGAGPGGAPPAPSRRAGGPAEFSQVVGTDGVARDRQGGLAIGVVSGDRAAAGGGGAGAPFLTDRTADGVHLRVITVPIEGLGAVQLGRSLESVDAVLGRLRIVLALLVLAGTAFAALLARLFARPVIRPISELTRAAEHIEATGDLGRRLGARGEDEVGRMAQRFDAMLDRVQASQAAQRQLVADASHELRTPVTSLRTNMEVLLAGAELEEGERRALLRDMVGQSEELSGLVADLIELARGDEGDPSIEDVALDVLVGEAAARARRHAAGVRFRTDLEPCVIAGVPERLGRAVNNVLDNAAAFSPPGGVVEVALREGVLEVRDHGPGAPEDELGQLFDRFFRGTRRRTQGGSGLGLAIVRQVAEAHGATVEAANAPGGGLVVRLAFAPVAATESRARVRVA
ncbi:MAG TPA: HAMP domain-containing sensor histidine kinase [Solirubrobacteraceae bacterium]